MTGQKEMAPSCQGRFRLDIGEDVFPESVVQPSPGCPGQWWGHCPGGFKRCKDVALGDRAGGGLGSAAVSLPAPISVGLLPAPHGGHSSGLGLCPRVTSGAPGDRH